MPENPPKSETALNKARTVFTGFIAFFCLGFILIYAKNVILPFLIAFFAMIVLSPLVRWMRKVHVPIWIAVPTAMASIGVLLFGIGVVFYLNLSPVIEAGPRYEKRTKKLLRKAERAFKKVGLEEKHLRILVGMEEEAAPPPDRAEEDEAGGGEEANGRGNETREGAEDEEDDDITSVIRRVKEHSGSIISFLTGGVTSFMGFLGQAILVLIYTLFMLFESTRFHEKAEEAFGKDSPVFDTLHAIGHDVQIYMLWKTVISLITGGITALVCTAFGVDFPLFWGILAFGFNYIPNIGSVISSILPALLALFQFDTPFRALGLLATLVVFQNLMGSLIEPRLMGKSLSISPLVLLLSLVFWGWIWGIVGMILAVPIAVTLKIIAMHTPGFDRVGILSKA